RELAFVHHRPCYQIPPRLELLTQIRQLPLYEIRRLGALGFIPAWTATQQAQEVRLQVLRHITHAGFLRTPLFSHRTSQNSIMPSSTNENLMTTIVNPCVMLFASERSCC